MPELIRLSIACLFAACPSAQTADELPHRHSDSTQQTTVTASTVDDLIVKIKALSKRKAGIEVLAPLLKQALRRGDTESVNAAISALSSSNLNATVLVKDMVRYLEKNPDREVNAKVIEVLGDLGVKGTQPAVSLFLERSHPDSSSSFFGLYTKGLIQIGYLDPNVVKTLFERMVRDEFYPHDWYGFAAGQLYLGFFRLALESKDSFKIEKCLESFGNHSSFCDRVDAKDLLSGMGFSSEKVQRELVDLITNFPAYELEVLPYCDKFLRSQDPKVRDYVLLNQIVGSKNLAKEIVLLKLKIAGDAKVSVEVRREIIRSINSAETNLLADKKISLLRSLLLSQDDEIRKIASIELACIAEHYDAESILAVIDGEKTGLKFRAIEGMRFKPRMSPKIASRFRRKLIKLFSLEKPSNDLRCERILATYDYGQEIGKACLKLLKTDSTAERVFEYLGSLGRLPTELKPAITDYLHRKVVKLDRPLSSLKNWFSNAELVAMIVDPSVPKENRKGFIHFVEPNKLTTAQLDAFLSLLDNPQFAKYVAVAFANRRVTNDKIKLSLTRIIHDTSEFVNPATHQGTVPTNILGNRGAFLANGIESLIEDSGPEYFEFLSSVVLDCAPKNSSAVDAMFRRMRQLIVTDKLGAQVTSDLYAKLGDRFVVELQSMLHDEDARLIKFACVQLSYLSGFARFRDLDVFQKRLEFLIKHQDQEIGRAAKDALIQIAPDKYLSINVLREKLKSAIDRDCLEDKDVSDVVFRVGLLNRDKGQLVDELIQLAKKHPSTRFDVFRVIANIGPNAEQAVPFLLGQLKTPFAIDAAKALLAIGNLDAKNVNSVITILHDYEYPNPWFPISANGDVDGIVKAIRTNLRSRKHMDASLRFAALLGPKAKSLAADLENLLADKSNSVRKKTAYAIASIASPDLPIGKSQLLKMLHSQSQGTEAALYALAKMRSPEAYKILRKDLNQFTDFLSILNFEDQFDDYAVELMEAIEENCYLQIPSVGDQFRERLRRGRFRDKDLVQKLLSLLNKFPLHRLEISETLVGAIGDRGNGAKLALKELERILVDCPASLRIEIEKAIQKIDPKRAEALKMPKHKLVDQ